MNFQDFWNKFYFIFAQLCVKKTCAFVVMGIGKEKSINSHSAFCPQSAVCILYLVLISYPVCSLQSAFCTDRICIAVFVRGSLKSEPKYRGSNYILVRLSWPCGVYVLLSLSNPTNILFFPREFLCFTEINLDFFRMRDYFRSQSAVQLPSTEYNFRPRSRTSVNICFTSISHSLLSA